MMRTGAVWLALISLAAGACACAVGSGSAEDPTMWERAGEIDSLRQSDVIPLGEVVLSRAELFEVVPVPGTRSEAPPCLLRLRAQLLSQGNGLRVLTMRAPASGCGTAEPELRSYDLVSAQYVDGRKIYKGESTLGRLDLFDNRAFGHGPAWSVSVLEKGADPWAWRTLHATTVDDQNLTPSGDVQVHLRVQLDRRMDMQELERLFYPLLLDPAATTPVDANDPIAYRAAVVSDLPVAHVLSQLRILPPVLAVDLSP